MKDEGAIIGIDLGTSHSSLAVFREAGEGSGADLLPIPQLAGAHETVSEPLLPSVYFHNLEYDDLRLPWQANPPLIGRWARDLAITNPERAIVSAKSWLCYRGDLRLPPKAEWNGLTAKEVSTLLLSHLMSAWEHTHQKQRSEAIAVAIAVPASFDPLARQLTEEAAKAAGIPAPLLIEEPLAAFYSWLAAHKDWNKKLKTGDSVLICDVGGGTCDFSLISVNEEAESGELKLDRIAVGRHLLLGGDNMDLALAHALAQKEGTLDHWQFVSLQQQVRKAKEVLLSPGNDTVYPLSVASRGSSLFTQTKRLDLTRDDVESILVEGFFPDVDADATLRRPLGLGAGGLPYEHDPAITKHLAAFLRQGREGSSHHPTHILFNGGVFKAAVLQERIVGCVNRWSGESGAAVVRLENPDLDHAVTLGATYYAAWKTHGKKLQVRTAAARSYFIGIEANELAVPGVRPKLQGLCVLPQGTEEGSTYALTEQEFALWGGDHVTFQLFSSSERADLGSLIGDAEKHLDEVAHLSCSITAAEEGPIPVLLQSDFDETGKLRIAIRAKNGPGQWDLDFQLRGDEQDKR